MLVYLCPHCNTESRVTPDKFVERVIPDVVADWYVDAFTLEAFQRLASAQQGDSIKFMRVTVREETP